MSLNQSMNISISSMKNNQYALTVVAHNIANVNTEGYYRQGVNFTEVRYPTDGNNVIAEIKGMNGAMVSSLTDYVDDAAFKGVLDSNSDAQYYNTLTDALGELEDLADALGDNGLNALLNDFYAAAANLEQFPTDMSIRQQYILAAQNVCEKFNQVSDKCTSIQDDKFNTITVQTETINTLLSNLAKVNQEHVKNGQSTATKTQMNEILAELSNYMDVTTTTNKNGSVNLLVSGIEIVKGGEQKYSIQADFNKDNPDNTVQFSLKSTEDPSKIIDKGINESFNGGSIKAYVDFLNGTNNNFTNINDIKSAMDEAAESFATELNNIQTYDDGKIFAASITTAENGNLMLEKLDPPVEMFSTKDGSNTFTAANIGINQAIIDDPFKIAAARIDTDKYLDEATGQPAIAEYDSQGNPIYEWTKAVGNSDNATEITALQHKKVCSYGGDIDNCTLSQFLTNNAAKIGMDVANIASQADTAQDIADMDAQNFSNLVGVNLDEELSDMIKYQRSYEASARLFSTINQLMETIIGMV